MKEDLNLILTLIRYTATFPFDSNLHPCKDKHLKLTWLHMIVSVLMILHSIYYPAIEFTEGRLLEYAINNVEYIGGVIINFQIVGWLWMKSESLKKIRKELDNWRCESLEVKKYSLSVMGKIFVIAFLFMNLICFLGIVYMSIMFGLREGRESVLFLSNYLFVLSLTGQFVAFLDCIDGLQTGQSDCPTPLSRYQTLTSVVSLVREVYEPQILVIFTWNFVLSLSAIYLILGPGFNKPLNFIIYIDYLFFLICPIILIIAACNRTTNKIKNVHHEWFKAILGEESGELMRNDELIFHFTAVKDISFTACGFFNLDKAVICSMIATGTTYLVILLQYAKTK